ncbi:type II toxin-antitoxin system HipA family toxin [Geobacter sulfurreducens]|uniref:type II toxin-antitoxin system HipA family toxin n=1 Tax=Geobacter sulfurreducens TaxID=35554 RepID=UPI0020B8A7D3|nr:HipA domain-containing protein [Geobacter sulfurreducens]
MMNSNLTELYVWIWLPNETEPVVAGRLAAQGRTYIFNYGRSYLERHNAIPIYDAELPLTSGVIPLVAGLTMPGCLRDASPDAWGRRVILNKRFGKTALQIDPGSIDELSYLIESGSDRIGALDFQRSPTEYIPRLASGAPLEELIKAAELVEKGVPLTPELAQALQHGTSIGGARPKALVQSDNHKFIAKFSTSTDLYSVVKAEFIAMKLALMAGLHVAPVNLLQVAGKDVLMVERFDRVAAPAGWQRKGIVSVSGNVKMTHFGNRKLTHSSSILADLEGRHDRKGRVYGSQNSQEAGQEHPGDLAYHRTLPQHGQEIPQVDR